MEAKLNVATAIASTNARSVAFVTVVLMLLSYHIGRSKNLKSLVTGIKAKIHPDQPYMIFPKKHNETHYIHSKQISIYLLFMHTHWPRPQGENASWLLNPQTRAAVNVSNENKEK